jgi:hypothetical protein
MKDIQKELGELAHKIEQLGFNNLSFHVEIADREKCRAQISFAGEEDEARKLGGYLEKFRMHYEARISFTTEREEYKIIIHPPTDKEKHEIERKTAIKKGLTQLIKDITNYAMKTKS